MRRKTTIVALARKLLVALWKYVSAGIVIEGASRQPPSGGQSRKLSEMQKGCETGNISERCREHGRVAKL